MERSVRQTFGNIDIILYIIKIEDQCAELILEYSVSYSF